MDEKADVLGVLEQMQHEVARVSYDGQLTAAELRATRAAVADLIDAARNVVARDELDAAVARLENVLGCIQ